MKNSSCITSEIIVLHLNSCNSQGKSNSNFWSCTSEGVHAEGVPLDENIVFASVASEFWHLLVPCPPQLDTSWCPSYTSIILASVASEFWHLLVLPGVLSTSVCHFMVYKLRKCCTRERSERNYTGIVLASVASEFWRFLVLCTAVHLGLTLRGAQITHVLYSRA